MRAELTKGDGNTFNLTNINPSVTKRSDLNDDTVRFHNRIIDYVVVLLSAAAEKISSTTLGKQWNIHKKVVKVEVEVDGKATTTYINVNSFIKRLHSGKTGEHKAFKEIEDTDVKKLRAALDIVLHNHEKDKKPISVKTLAEETYQEAFGKGSSNSTFNSDLLKGDSTQVSNPLYSNPAQISPTSPSSLTPLLNPDAEIDDDDQPLGAWSEYSNPTQIGPTDDLSKIAQNSNSTEIESTHLTQANSEEPLHPAITIALIYRELKNNSHLDTANIIFEKNEELKFLSDNNENDLIKLLDDLRDQDVPLSAKEIIKRIHGFIDEHKPLNGEADTFSKAKPKLMKWISEY